MRLNKKKIVTAWAAAMALNVIMAAAKAQDNAESSPLGVTLDTTLVTQYIWRGYDLFDDHGAFQPSVDFDLFGTGFSVNIWGAIPTGSSGSGPNTSDGISGWQEYDYTLAYGICLFEEEIYALDVSTNWIYYDYPKLSRDYDAQELGLELAMPKLIPIGPKYVVPSYYLGVLYPASGGRNAQSQAGRYHEFGLDYDIVVPAFLPPCDQEQVLSIGWDIAYSDGMFGVSEWTHTTFNITVPMTIGPLDVSPFLAYQITMEEDVNDDKNEFYGGLSVSCSF